MKLDFRAWDKTRNEIVDVMDIDLSIKKVGVCNVPKRMLNGGLHTIHSVKREWDEVELMQCTGLKDKNGVEIYEKDIVRVTDDDGRTDFSDGGIGTVCELEELYMWYIDGQVHNALFDINQCYYIEVIGNVYENPELLEVEKWQR